MSEREGLNAMVIFALQFLLFPGCRLLEFLEESYSSPEKTLAFFGKSIDEAEVGKGNRNRSVLGMEDIFRSICGPDFQADLQGQPSIP